MARSRARAGRVAVLAVGIASLTAISACGESDWQYVSNQGERTYLKVPRGWTEISESEIEAGLFSASSIGTIELDVARARIWATAYDSATEASTSHFLGLDSVSLEPAVFLFIRQLPEPERGLAVFPGDPGLDVFPESERGSVSLDRLRNLYRPVTDEARATLEEQGLEVKFELLYEEILTPGDGVHGVRIIYNYGVADGPLHTFDQTAYTTGDSSRIYLLVIRCAAICYREQATELGEIASSFTVRGPE